MIKKKDFKKGWSYSASLAGAQESSSVGHDYVEKIVEQIEIFSSDMNSYAGRNQSNAVLGGVIAEVWHSGTFNNDAIAAGSSNRAIVERSNEHASVDISTQDQSFSLKYLKDADMSVKAQAKNVIQNYNEYYSSAKARGTKNPMTFKEYCDKYNYSDDSSLYSSVYTGQGRIIPKDQLQAGLDKLKRWIATESMREGPNREYNLKNYIETYEKLSDRIKDNDGIESVPLSKEDAEKIAELCKKGNFKPEDFGISLDKIIKYQYLLNQSIKGGFTSATMTFAIQFVPKVISLFEYLIKKKEIDKKKFLKEGMDCLSASTKSFVIGFLTCGLYITCKKGKLGPSLINANASIIGSITALSLDIIQKCFMKGIGLNTDDDIRNSITKSIFQTISSLFFGKISVSVLKTVSGIAFSIGSMLGSVFAGIVYDIGDRFLVSLCVNSGYTLFGLVKQDYRLPTSVLKDMGLSICEIDKVQVDYNCVDRYDVDRVNVDYYNIDRIRIRILKRGIIEFHKIGYIF